MFRQNFIESVENNLSRCYNIKENVSKHTTYIPSEELKGDCYD